MKIWMLKKLKNNFGGDFIKENGKLYWLKDAVKQLVTFGLLKYYLDKPQTQQPVKEEPKVEKKPAKKVAKKNAKSQSNPDVSQGS